MSETTTLPSVWRAVEAWGRMIETLKTACSPRTVCLTLEDLSVPPGTLPEPLKLLHREAMLRKESRSELFFTTEQLLAALDASIEWFIALNKQ